MALPKAPRDLFSADVPTKIPIVKTNASPFGSILFWAQDKGLWWFSSFMFHLILVCSLAMISGKVVEKIVDEAPTFENANLPPIGEVPQNIERFDLGETPQDPSALDTETLTVEKPATVTQDEKYYDDSAEFADRGGGTSSGAENATIGGIGEFDIKSILSGPAVHGKGGVGAGIGTGVRNGAGGDGIAFGGRGAGSRKAMLASGGGTKQSERAVAAALNWLARHQMADGSWSIKSFNTRCVDEPCTGPGSSDFASAGTALGLLPFLAAGQTHASPGPYKKNIHAGIFWLISNQKPDGDLRTNGNMYAHGLATIALCEAYGMSGSKPVGRAAQSALNFIMQAQNASTGGWRYSPGETGDTSVVGWQVMALKSGQMACLNVNPDVFEKAKKFLATVSSGENHGLFSYTPAPPTPSIAMTSVGLLCQQYMHMARNDPTMIEGVSTLMQHLPDPEGEDKHNLYYWYYATQVMHNIPGPEWDTWNRKMRRILIETQVRDGCAAGSWDPAPKDGSKDVWGSQGGRLMMTSLSALTLEVYYRYLPLYKLDKEEEPSAIETSSPDATKLEEDSSKLDAP